MRYFICAFLLGVMSALAGDAISIMSVGDSISRRGHLQTLQECLQSAGITNYEFVGPVSMPGEPKPTNRLAYGGNTLEDILDGRVLNGEHYANVPDAVAAYQPDIVLLMGGINNIVRLKDGEGLEETEQAWNALVDYFATQCPKTMVFVGGITPVNSKKAYASRQTLIDKFNAYLEAEVRSRQLKGQKLVYVDTGSTLNDADFNSDGLHPNPSGDTKIGKAWFQALKNSGETPLKIRP